MVEFAPWLSFVTEIVKGLAWPAAAVVAFYLFRSEIRALISRITGFGAAGLTVQASSQISAEVDTKAVARTSEELRQFISSEQVDPAIESITRSIPQDVQSSEAKIKLLTSLAAGATILLHHERTYSAIFGSQIRFLRLLERGGAMSEASAQIEYEIASSTEPVAYAAYPFERWRGFLENSGLIQKNAAGLYELTPTGHGFLRYLGQRNLPEAKAY